MGTLPRLAALAMWMCPLASPQVVVDSRHAAELLAQLDPTANNSLQCEIMPVAPALTFSFRFQAGYLARVPLHQFHGPGHSLSMLIRVTPAFGSQPIYLLRTFDLPDVPDTELAADLAGGFFVGEGIYQSNAILFDDIHRACRGDWRIEVRSGRTERNRLLIPPNEVAAISAAGSGPPKSGAPGLANRMTILLHAASLNPGNLKLQARDVVTMIGSLAALLEELPAHSVRLVIFNLHMENELYRNDAFTAGDLEQVTRVLDSMQLGMVDYRALQHPQAEREVLRNLIHREVSEANRSSDVIFIGPDGSYGRDNPAAPEDTPAPGQRFFYLQFQSDGPLFAATRAVPSIMIEPRPPIPCQNVSTDPCGPTPPNTTAPPALIREASRTGSDSEAIAAVIRKLKGRVLLVRTPADFGKAVDRIGQPGR